MVHLSETEFEYIAAVLTDENFEFTLDENDEFSFFTDWEGDGYFLPSVTVTNTELSDDEVEERVDSLLSEYDWFEYAELEVDHQSGIRHVYFSGEKIDQETIEFVEERL